MPDGYVWEPNLGGDDSGMYQVRFRWYVVALGRWGNRDPLAIRSLTGIRPSSGPMILLQYADGPNLYQYALSEPLTNKDSRGTGPLKLLYTGDWFASDEEYEAALDGAADWLLNDSPLRGVYGGVGVDYRPTYPKYNNIGHQIGESSCLTFQAGLVGSYTLDCGGSIGIEGVVGVGNEDAWLGSTAGFGWSEGNGWGGSYGLIGGHRSVHGVYTEQYWTLGLNHAFGRGFGIYGGVIIDPARLGNLFGLGWGKSGFSPCGCGGP